MSNLTLSIDDELLRRARIRALQQRTSVNALVRDFLLAYAGPDDELQARAAFVALANSVSDGPRRSERKWTREELYEERTRWPRS